MSQRHLKRHIFLVLPDIKLNTLKGYRVSFLSVSGSKREGLGGMIATALRAMILRIGVVSGPKVVVFEKPNEVTCSLGTHQRWQLAESVVPHTLSLGTVNDRVSHVATQTKELWHAGMGISHGRAQLNSRGFTGKWSLLCSLEIFMLLHSKNHRPCRCRKKSESGPKCSSHTVVAFSATQGSILRSGRSLFCPVSAQSLYAFQCDSSRRKT